MRLPEIEFLLRPIDFFEEIAKYRAARRIWSLMKERYGATDRGRAVLPFSDRRCFAHRSTT